MDGFDVVMLEKWGEKIVTAANGIELFVFVQAVVSILTFPKRSTALILARITLPLKMEPI
jgi:hypothetical protein